MNIDRNNCEAYFLDYYEDRLSREEIEALFGFLDQHPELYSEFQAYGSIPDTDVLLNVPENESLEFSGSLKKRTTDDDLIALLEGQLNDTDRKTLEDLLEQDEILTSRFALYQKTISQPDLHIQYPNKRHLKKGAPIIPMVLRYGAVAALLSGAFLSVWIYQYQGPTENLTVLNDSGDLPKAKIEDVAPESKQSFVAANYTEHADEIVTEEVEEKNVSSPAANASTTPKATQVKVTSSGPSQSASESTPPKDLSPRTEFASMATLEPIHISGIPVAKTSKSIRDVQLLENTTQMPTADVPVQKEETTNPSSETLFGTFLSDMGESMVDRFKTVAGDKVVVDKVEQQESDIVTSTFKLGSFEIYRSRAKK